MSARIEYELTAEDATAFVEFCVRNTPEYVRVVRLNQWVGILVILGTSIAFSVNYSSLGLLVAGVAAAVAFAWACPRQVISNARERMLRQTRICRDGKHVLEATDEGVRASCDVGDSLIRWPALESIVEAEEHVFLILDPGRGFMISRKRIVAGNLGEFVRAVQDFLRATRAGSSSASPSSESA